MQCSNCGSKNPKAATFCVQCGVPLSQPEGAQRSKSQTGKQEPWLARLPLVIMLFLAVLLCLSMAAIVVLNPLQNIFFAVASPPVVARVTQIGTPESNPTSVRAPQPTETARPTDTLALSPTLQATVAATLVGPRLRVTQQVNVRQGPGLSFPVIGRLPANTSATIVGKSEDGAWLLIPFPDETQLVWVAASVVIPSGSLESTQIIAVTPNPTTTRGIQVAAASPTITLTVSATSTTPITVVPTRAAPASTATQVPPTSVPTPAPRTPTATFVPPPTAAPTPLPTALPVAQNVQGKWEMTYAGIFRDRTIYYYDLGKVASGIWGTAQFRVKNLQPATDAIGLTYDLVAIDQDGKTFAENYAGTLNAAWQYCRCNTDTDLLARGQTATIVVTFDVPIATRTLTIALQPKIAGASSLAAPRFLISDFNLVPSWKGN